MTSREQRLINSMARMHDPWGGAHCLDFANTLEPRGGPPPLHLPLGYVLRDELQTYDDLVGWAAHKGTITPTVCIALLAAADDDPDESDRVLVHSHELRDAIYRAFWQIAHGEAVAKSDLTIIIQVYADASAHAMLVDGPDGMDWDWSLQAAVLAHPLWPVARSAVDLLMHGARDRIKVCPGPGRPPLPCAWLFYDTTRNGSRRWCSMADCGSATKAHRQTTRRRAKRQPPHP